MSPLATMTALNTLTALTARAARAAQRTAPPTAEPPFEQAPLTG
ncbi:hypothetical protein [Kitasatospora kifunensis]|uniref:Uncharacterized protein n=1 Tax=Kitasatospora kifunensis TaxID=58351 RepID=A0A7W7R8H4_KITKI|nr:hypothetical protein [Kitasatospora kifunensis]MBB4927363.1 hypothetical protein [Kitasatospora kifunensis]